ncbi:MAG: VOC family protein [Renibacterium sp.]|nr:VOC family protein [Renibacterium sp.]
MTTPFHSVAHLGGVELFTPCLEESVGFFQGLLGMDVVSRTDAAAFLHCWDDYLPYTLKLTQREQPGIGALGFRAASQAALELVVANIQGAGRPGEWVEPQNGIGPAYLSTDPDGHPIYFFFECTKYTAPPQLRPALKNQAARFPGAGVNARRLDHVNFLAADVPANGGFVAEALGGKATEQIRLDDGSIAAQWLTFGQKTYDVVYTRDWTGSNGRLHHIAFATDTREDILKAADVFLENGVFIETGPHKHAIQQTFFLYVYEPGGNRIEFCNPGARLSLDPDLDVVTWTEAERSKGQAWGMKTIETFHTHGTPPVP